MQCCDASGAGELAIALREFAHMMNIIQVVPHGRMIPGPFLSCFNFVMEHAEGAYRLYPSSKFLPVYNYRPGVTSSYRNQNGFIKPARYGNQSPLMIGEWHDFASLIEALLCVAVPYFGRWRPSTAGNFCHSRCATS